MPAAPHVAPLRATGRVRAPLAELALTDPGEWPPERPAALPRDAPAVDTPRPGLAVGAALMAIALMVTALDPSLRTGASAVPGCGQASHHTHAGPGVQGGGPPRRQGRALTP